MRIHHLNCGTFCPFGGTLFDGLSRGLGEACLVCHCLLVETERELVLVDTGLGLGDVYRPRPRLSRFFLDLLRPRLREEDTAVHQIRRLGFSPRDVRHIVLTHLDFDHAGGIEDFPGARIHLMGTEKSAAQARKGFIARRRYRPEQFDEIRAWNTYEAGGDPWFGFEAVRELKGLPPEFLLVPLPGHSWGHAGVAIRTGAEWLLHAGDAYFYRHELDPASPRCTPGLLFYQRMMEVDRRARLKNQRRIRELARAHQGQVTVCSAHDPVELLMLAEQNVTPLAAESA